MATKRRGEVPRVGIECVADEGALLGEGTLWDADRGVVWWLDIKASTLFAHDVNRRRNRRQFLSHRVTAIGLTTRGDLISCGDAGFATLRVDDDLEVELGEILARPDEPAGNRFNDGKVDAEGRFWAGTMDDAEQSASGHLYRLDGRHVDRLRSGIAVPNGPCFLADGTVLLAHTALGRIVALRPNGEDRVFAEFPTGAGYPDGMTVDEEDHVWVAFWNGGCLRRLDPSGRVVREVRLPVRRPTCPTFGGTDHDRLYVATAAIDASTAENAGEFRPGGLLRLDVGVRGRAPGRFALP